MWVATLALNGLISVGVPQDWSTHLIGHELTTLYGIDHAHTLAIILPSVLTIQKEGNYIFNLQNPHQNKPWNVIQGFINFPINLILINNNIIIKEIKIMSIYVYILVCFSMFTSGAITVAIIRNKRDIRVNKILFQQHETILKLRNEIASFSHRDKPSQDSNNDTSQN